MSFLKLKRETVDSLDAISSRKIFWIIILQLTAITKSLSNERNSSFKDMIPVKISFLFHETTEHNRKKLFQQKTPSQLDSHEEMKTKSLLGWWKRRIKGRREKEGEGTLSWSREDSIENSHASPLSNHFIRIEKAERCLLKLYLSCKSQIKLGNQFSSHCSQSLWAANQSA